MHQVSHIMGKELKDFFISPIAYIVIFAFLIVAGWMFFSPFFLIGRADMRRFFAPELFSPATWLVLVAPAVSMRLLAEEKKTGTIELLSTLPITDAQVILDGVRLQLHVDDGLRGNETRERDESAPQIGSHLLRVVVGPVEDVVRAREIDRPPGGGTGHRGAG